MELDFTDIQLKQIREKKVSLQFGANLGSILTEILAQHVIAFKEESLDSSIVQKILDKNLDQEKVIKKVEEIL